MIAPQPPGGQVDVVSRLLAQKLSEQWGQTVLVENRPGGGTVIGTQAIAKAPPDGYTFGMVLPAHVINPTLRSDLPYDTLRDFAPLSLLGSSTLALVAHPLLPANNVAELIDLAKSRPGSIECASLGVGNTTHLAQELFNALAGVKMVHVPYNGSPPAYQDMLAGRVKLGFVTLQSSTPHLKAGRLKLIGIATTRRSAVYPDLPVIGETLKGFHVDSFMGFVAPAGIPADAAARLSSDLARVVRADATRARLIEFGIEPVGSNADEFAAFLRDEIARWRPIVKAAGIKPD
jgi:tripartite-type tricarboxylate transporter receptor subunit TctC